MHYILLSQEMEQSDPEYKQIFVLSDLLKITLNYPTFLLHYVFGQVFWSKSEILLNDFLFCGTTKLTNTI